MTVTQKDLHKTSHFLLRPKYSIILYNMHIKRRKWRQLKEKTKETRNLRESVPLRIKVYCETESRMKSKIRNINHMHWFFLHTEMP